MTQAVFLSPLGFIRLTEENEALTALDFDASATPLPSKSPLLCEAIRQLNAYFFGTLKSFSLPLAPQGTPFQNLVWEGLCRIPYGNVVSYGRLAEIIGRPGACRAVGQANGKNPLPILIPCHRVIWPAAAWEDTLPEQASKKSCFFWKAYLHGKMIRPFAALIDYHAQGKKHGLSMLFPAVRNIINVPGVFSPGGKINSCSCGK